MGPFEYGNQVGAHTTAHSFPFPRCQGKPVMTLEGHTDEVRALALLADQRLASGSDDTSVRVHDPVTGVHEAPTPVVPLLQLHRSAHENPIGAYGRSACAGATARWLRNKLQQRQDHSSLGLHQWFAALLPKDCIG